MSPWVWPKSPKQNKKMRQPISHLQMNSQRNPLDDKPQWSGSECRAQGQLFPGNRRGRELWTDVSSLSQRRPGSRKSQTEPYRFLELGPSQHS